MPAPTQQVKRPVRSYVIRSGRLTDSQRRAIAAHWDQHVIPFQAGAIDWAPWFSNTAPMTVEIGFGMGASLLEMAKADPARNFLGIEVHQPGIGKVLHGIAEAQLVNLKLMCHDASEVLAQCFADGSIDRVQIFFPDPWPKKRHHKRRLVQAEFVQLIASKLATGGTLHLATDWQPYAEYMMEVLGNADEFENCCGAGNYWLQAQRPATKFEQRGRRLGHGVWDLLFRKLSAD